MFGTYIVQKKWSYLEEKFKELNSLSDPTIASGLIAGVNIFGKNRLISLTEKILGKIFFQEQQKN